MQTLHLADNLFGYVRSGAKHVTVRAGHVRVVPGPLTFLGHDGRIVRVRVTRVHYTVAGRMLPSEYRGDGAESAAALVKTLRRFYPGLRADSPVTVITFTRAETRAEK